MLRDNRPSFCFWRAGCTLFGVEYQQNSGSSARVRYSKDYCSSSRLISRQVSREKGSEVCGKRSEERIAVTCFTRKYVKVLA